MSKDLPAKHDLFESPIDSMRMGNDDLIDSLPVLKILYNTTNAPKNFKKGALTLAGEQQFDNLDVVLLAAKYVGNILWDKYDPKDDNPAPICKSSDGINPTGGSKPFQMSCQECGRSDWRWFDEKGEAPPCKKTTALLLWERNEMTPMIHTVQRRARTVQFKKLRSALDRKIMQVQDILKKVKGAQVNWCYALTMVSEPYETYYLPSWTIREELSSEEVAEIQNIYKNVAPMFFGTELQEIADGDRVGGKNSDDDDLPF